MEIFGKKYGCFLKTCHFKTFVQCFRQSTDKLTMTPVCTDAWMSTQDCQLLFSFETIKLKYNKTRKSNKNNLPAKTRADINIWDLTYQLEFDEPYVRCDIIYLSRENLMCANVTFTWENCVRK